jgi:hypothetical protein
MAHPSSIGSDQHFCAALRNVQAVLKRPRSLSLAVVLLVVGLCGVAAIIALFAWIWYLFTHPI